jgi:hypothetical protein
MHEGMQRSYAEAKQFHMEDWPKNSDGGWMNGNRPHHGLTLWVLTTCAQVNTCLPGAACTPFSIHAFLRNLGQHLVNSPP